MSGLVAVRYAVTHTGAVITNDALPIATDRPMGGRFPWRYSKSDFSRSRVNICQTLLLSLGARLSTSCPLRLVGVGLPQMPLEPTKKQQGAWLCQAA